MHLGRRWYLVAWDCDREDWRTFRVDRLERPSAGGPRFAPREVPGGDAAAYVAANLSGAPYRYQARITLHAPAAEMAGAGSGPAARVEPIDERTCVLRTSDDSLDWLAIRIGMIGVEFEVHEPPELVERFASWPGVSRERRGSRAGSAMLAARAPSMAGSWWRAGPVGGHGLRLRKLRLRGVSRRHPPEHRLCRVGRPRLRRGPPASTPFATAAPAPSSGAPLLSAGVSARPRSASASASQRVRWWLLGRA